MDLIIPSPKTKSKSPRGFLPRPLLRADKIQRKSQSRFCQIQIPRKQFGKTESTELVLEFRQFLLWRNPTSPATTILKIENRSCGKSKQNAWWRGEGGAEQQKRRQTVVPDSLVERRLCRDGVRRGAYDYISNYKSLGA